MPNTVQQHNTQGKKSENYDRFTPKLIFPQNLILLRFEQLHQSILSQNCNLWKHWRRQKITNMASNMNFASKIREAINQIDWTVYVLLLGTDIIRCKEYNQLFEL